MALGKIGAPGTQLRAPLQVRYLRPGAQPNWIDYDILRYSDITIPTASILGMNAAPLDLSTLDANLGAPGAGNIIAVDFVLAELVYNSATYANGGAGSITYGSGGGAAHATAIPVGLFTAAVNEIFYTPGGAAAALASSAAVNIGLFLTNATAPFITGNSPVHMLIGYRILGNGALA